MNSRISGGLYSLSCTFLWLLIESEATNDFYCTEATGVPIHVNSSDVYNLYTKYDDQQRQYANDMHCFWSVRTDENKRLHFKVASNDVQYAPQGANCYGYDRFAFKEEDIQDSYDWSNAEPGMYFTWCGDDHPGNFISRDNEAYLEFFTNDRNTYSPQGIHLEIKSFDVGRCPPEWTEDSSRDSNHCYKLSTHRSSWVDAQDYCNKQQANLVIFEDDQEADFVTGLIRNSTSVGRTDLVWIGLNDITKNSEYEWIGGAEVGIPYRWEKSSNHAADEYDNCVAVRKIDGLWQEDYCTEADIQTTVLHQFVCKTNKAGGTLLYAPPSDKGPGVKGRNNKTLPIVVVWIAILTAAIVIAVLVVVVCVICCSNRKSHNRRKKSRRSPDIELPAVTGSNNTMRQEANQATAAVPSAPLLHQVSTVPKREIAPPTYDEAMNS